MDAPFHQTISKNKEKNVINKEIFGRKLADLRRRSNLTQQMIASSCFVSVQAVSKWEHGRSCPDILILDDLARTLGVKIEDLFHTT